MRPDQKTPAMQRVFQVKEMASVKDQGGKELVMCEEHRRLEGLKHGEGWRWEGMIQDETGERQEQLCF